MKLEHIEIANEIVSKLYLIDDFLRYGHLKLISDIRTTALPIPDSLVYDYLFAERKKLIEDLEKL